MSEPVKINMNRRDALLILCLLFFIFSLGSYELLFNRGHYSTFALTALVVCAVGLLVTLFGFFTLISKRFAYTGPVLFSSPVGPDITITEEEIICKFSSGQVDHIRWNNVAKVQVLTTDEGPYVCDVFYILTDTAGKGVAIPQDKPESGTIIEKITRWPGFQHEEMVLAMGSTEVKWFTVWEKEVGPVN